MVASIMQQVWLLNNVLTKNVTEDVILTLLSKLTLVTVLEVSPEYLTRTTTNLTKASMVW